VRSSGYWLLLLLLVVVVVFETFNYTIRTH